MLSLTMMSKVVNEATRGTLFALNGLIGGIGVTFIQAVGGNLYDSTENHYGPFLIALAGYVISALVTLVLGVRGKLM